MHSEGFAESSRDEARLELDLRKEAGTSQRDILPSQGPQIPSGALELSRLMLPLTMLCELRSHTVASLGFCILGYVCVRMCVC